MRRFLSIIFITICLMRVAYSQQKSANHWVDSIYTQMNWQQRIGQFFVIPFQDEKTSLHLLEKYHVGGFILPGGKPEEIRDQVEFLLSNASYPLWIGVAKGDGINPAVQSLPNAPHALTLKSLRDSLFHAEAGYVMGDLLSAMGINFHIMQEEMPMYQLGMMRAGINVITPSCFYEGEEIPLKDRDIHPLIFKHISLGYESGVAASLVASVQAAVDFVVLDSISMRFLPTWHENLLIGLKKREIEQITKKLLNYKYGYFSAPYTREGLPEAVSRSNDALDLEYFLQNAFVYKEGKKDPLPIQSLEQKYFATLTTNSGTGAIFREGINRYVNSSHYTIDELDFEDQEMENYLLLYDWVFVVAEQPLSVSALRTLHNIALETNVLIYQNGDQLGYGEINPTAFHVLWNYTHTPYIHDIATQMIFGAEVISGKWPGEVAQWTPRTTKPLGRLRYIPTEKSTMKASGIVRIDHIMQEAIVKQAIPGGQLLVAKDGAVVFNRSYGYHTYDSLQPVSHESVYDLASVTKVLGTLQAVMWMKDQGKIDLNATISTYFPELKGTPKGKLVIKEILAHQSGLPSYYPFWQHTLDKSFARLPEYYGDVMSDQYSLSVTAGLYASKSMEDTLWHWINSDQVKLKSPKKYLYSDIGFMIIKKLIESQLGQPIDEFLKTNFYDPLGMYHTTYHPLQQFSASAIVPSEEDLLFRKKVLLGFVNDQNAAMIGGVAGHAGLFSTANDLVKIMQMLLQNGHYGGKQYLDSATVVSFSQKQFDKNRRGLGWDKPAFYPIHNTSEYCSLSTFGHTGFTGTAVWADPDNDLIFIFLSNRTYPSATNNKLSTLDVRKRLHDAVYASFAE